MKTKTLLPPSIKSLLHLSTNASGMIPSVQQCLFYACWYSASCLFMLCICRYILPILVSPLCLGQYQSSWPEVSVLGIVYPVLVLRFLTHVFVKFPVKCLNAINPATSPRTLSYSSALHEKLIVITILSFYVTNDCSDKYTQL